jgi:hypothetical protein
VTNGAGPARRYDLSPLRVVVGSHVTDRVRERLGVELSPDEIRQRVFDAIVNVRWSRLKPAWLGTGDYPYDELVVFAWDAGFTHAWVVRMGLTEELWIKTVLTPRLPEGNSLRGQLLQWLRRHGEEPA